MNSMLHDHSFEISINLVISLVSLPFKITSLQWRHNDRDGVSNHRCLDGLLNRFFQTQIKENITAHRWPVKSPHKGPVTRAMLPFDDVIMSMICIDSKQHGDVIAGKWLPHHWPLREESTVYWFGCQYCGPFIIFFDVILNKLLEKQSCCW